MIDRTLDDSVEEYPFVCCTSGLTSTMQCFFFQVEHLLNDFRSVLNERKTFDFDNSSSLNDDAYKRMTGLNKCKLQRISSKH